jgi:ABC-type multidrug transport system ATPase subunit
MNESILKALMRLFAIVADVNKQGHSDNERSIVMDYLDRQYSHEIAQKYLEYFDEQVKYFHPELMHSNDVEAHKQQISNEGNILSLLNQINEELDQEQRLVVIIYLLDFINRDVTTQNELKFVTSIANQLSIKEEEYNDIKAFTFGDLDEVVNKEWLLYIDAEENPPLPEIKHMPNEKMEGRIVVLHVPSVNIHVFRYEGKLNLFINGHNIKPDRSYIWSAGSVIKNPKIGPLYFSRMAGKFIQANLDSKFVFEAENIEFYYKNSSNGLKRFNLTEESGRLIGIIGGSGSGKSTLINVLNGNIKPRRGSIKINGFDIHEHRDDLKGIIGYVPQDDLLIKELTVFQNLYYNAKLCFNNYTEDRITQLVEVALVDFDLVEARDLNVGDAFTTILSGGQRKRLNIALELIREPSILFVDEPTSGLSSADSEKVIILLKRQALKGKLVITNIHQPSSDVFKMLDKLLVMDQGGRVIYYGNPVSAITYFKHASRYADADESECLSCGNINAEQILRIVEARVVDAKGKLTRKRKTSPEEWYQRYLREIDVSVQKTQREHEDVIPKTNFGIPNHFKQFKIFLRRDLMAKFHNKQYLFINALEAPLLAFILAFFTKNYTYIDGVPKYIFGDNPNMPAFLFMAVIVALFLGLIISAEEIFKDRKILKREKFLDLSRLSYLFSKIIILFSISAIQSLVFVLITNSMLDIKGMVFSYWIILFTASCWANLVGLIISSGLNSVVTIYILVPIILVPELLFSGVVVDFNKMHNKIASEKYVPVIGDIMTSRWAYEAIMVTQFKDNRFERQFYQAEKKIKNAVFYRSYSIPELRNIAHDSKQLRMQQGDTVKLANKLEILRHETEELGTELGWNIEPLNNGLQVRNFSDSVFIQFDSFLNRAEKRFISIYNNAVQERDLKYTELAQKLGGNEQFQDFKQKYYNKQLAFVMTNEKELNEFVIQNNELVRVRDAVFRAPESNNGRAHFYAPVKRIFNISINTLYFNLLFIWLFSGVLFIILYYDILRKVIAYFESLLLIRRTRRRLLRLLLIEQQNVKHTLKGFKKE